MQSIKGLNIIHVFVLWNKSSLHFTFCVKLKFENNMELPTWWNIKEGKTMWQKYFVLGIYVFCVLCSNSLKLNAALSILLDGLRFGELLYDSFYHGTIYGLIPYGLICLALDTGEIFEIDGQRLFVSPRYYLTGW